MEWGTHGRKVMWKDSKQALCSTQPRPPPKAPRKCFPCSQWRKNLEIESVWPWKVLGSSPDLNNRCVILGKFLISLSLIYWNERWTEGFLRSFYLFGLCNSKTSELENILNFPGKEILYLEGCGSGGSRTS